MRRSMLLLAAWLAALPAAGAGDLGTELKEQVGVVWAGLAGRSVADFSWRDKTTFASAYETAREHSASPTGERAAGELAAAIATVRGLADTNRRDPHYQWRVHSLLAQMLWEHGSREEAQAEMLVALAAYPDEDYADPAQHSSYQHLVDTAAGWTWDRAGVREAERFALEHFARDDAFTYFDLDWWVLRYDSAGVVERLGPLIDAVEEVYGQRARTDRRRRGLYEGYAAALTGRIVAAAHRVGDDARRTYFLLASRALKRTEHRHLVLVLPGGDGQAGPFLPWLMGLAQHLHERYVFAVISAPQWSGEQARSVTWVSAAWMGRYPEAAFPTEQLVSEVYADVRRLGAFRVDDTYLWGWSSSGQAVCAAVLDKEARYAGAYINSPSGRSERLDVSRARGRRFYLQQDRQDALQEPRWADLAAGQLSAAGARVKLDLIEGGHGFGSDELGNVRAALEWLGRRK